MDKIKIKESGIEGYFNTPEDIVGCGILVLHAWWGLNDFIGDFTSKLAEKGHYIFAPDLFNGRIAKNITEAEIMVNSVNINEIKVILKKSVDFLLRMTDKKLCVIGFSMGAGWATWLANNLSENVEKVVLFYGTGETDFSNTHASFLCHFAENDPYEELKYINLFKEELQKANIKAKHYNYPGTYHWFFESNQDEYYHKQAAELAWKRTLDYLQEKK